MTSVLLADARGGTVRGGAAAPPSAAQQRRTKRKMKAAKEKAVLVPALPRTGDDGVQGTGHGEGLTAEPTSAVALMPKLQCIHCRQVVPSRNALFDHLRIGHAELFAPSSLDDAGLPRPAANTPLQPMPQPPPDLERQLPLSPPRLQILQQLLEQDGGPGSSSAVTTSLRVVDAPAPHGPARPGRRRMGPYL